MVFTVYLSMGNDPLLEEGNKPTHNTEQTSKLVFYNSRDKDMFLFNLYRLCAI